MAALQEGVSSPEVKKVQHLINEYYQASIVPESGEFDGTTTAGVKRFQKDEKLPVTGAVDGPTLKLLTKPPTEKGRTVVYEGKTYFVPEAEWGNFKKEICKKAQKTIDAYKSKADEARSLWDAHNGVRKDTFFLIPAIVDVWGGGVFPSESVIQAAEKAVTEMQGKVAAGDVAALQAAISKGHAPILKALEAMKTYRDKLYAGGEALIKDLQAVRDGCVLTLEVSAMFATGGASVGVTAGVMAGLGAYKEVLVQIDKASTDPKVTVTDAFGNVLLAAAVDGTVGALTHDASFMGGLTKSVSKKIGGGALKMFGSEVISKVAEKAVKNGLDKALGEALKVLVESFKPGSKMTLEKAVEQIADKLVEGAAGGALFGVMDKQISAFSGNYSKYLKTGDFKGLGKVDITKALEKGGEEILDQALKRVGKDIVIQVAGDPSQAGNTSKMLADAIKADQKTNADLAALVKAKKLE